MKRETREPIPTVALSRLTDDPNDLDICSLCGPIPGTEAPNWHMKEQHGIEPSGYRTVEKENPHAD